MTTARLQSEAVAGDPLTPALTAIHQPDGHAERLGQNGQIVGERVGEPDQFGTGEQADAFRPATKQMGLFGAAQRAAVGGRLQAHFLMARQVLAVVALSTDDPRIDGDAIAHVQGGGAQDAAAVHGGGADLFDDRSHFMAGDHGKTQRAMPLDAFQIGAADPARRTASRMQSSARSSRG